MIVSISGASGFIGQALIRKIQHKDWIYKIIDRESLKLSDHEFLNQFIEGSDVVINLAGAPISKKWTPAYKEELISGRVNTTRKIAAAINNAERKPSVFISASAIGIYNSTETHTETSRLFASNYLAEICIDWEKEAQAAANSTRLVIFRLGLVLGVDGGALGKMHRLFRAGLGGKLGSGKQPVSFIHIRDLVDAFVFAIENGTITGIVNAVAPSPIDNAEFTKNLAKVFGQPAIFTVPEFALNLVYGEGAQVLLEGQKVLPEKLLEAGFKFQYPTIQNALVNIFNLRA
jgi:hypothetical protein